MRHSDFRVLLKYTGHQAITADIIYTLKERGEKKGNGTIKWKNESLR